MSKDRGKQLEEKRKRRARRALRKAKHLENVKKQEHVKTILAAKSGAFIRPNNILVAKAPTTVFERQTFNRDLWKPPE